MEVINERPGAAAKQRSRGDSFKQFVSTRRGAYTVAAIAATLAGLVLLWVADRYKDDVNAGIAPAPVLVADRLIPRGTSASEVISGKLFKPTPIAAENVRPGAVTQAAQIAGMAAVREILPGQQITLADFSAVADPIRSRLTKKERAVQIPVDAIHGMLGTVRPGDRIDILAAFDSANEATATGTPTVEWLVRDIRVMQNTGASVILETTDIQGARLAFAADNAKLWFLLRPPIGATESKATTISQDNLREFELSVSTEETENGGTVTIKGEATD